MPFSGQGSNIYEANDVFFSGVADQHVMLYNGGNAKWNNLTADNFLVGRSAMATRGGLETVVTANSGAGTYSVNIANGNVFFITLSGNVTFAFTGATAAKACSFTLYTKQGATVRTVTWPSSGTLKWAGGTAGTVTATAQKVDIFVFETVDGGTTWYGSLVGNNF